MLSVLRPSQQPSPPGDRQDSGREDGDRARQPAPVPDAPFALAAGEQRLVDDGQTVRFGSVRYSTPPGHVGNYVFCRVVGEELVITADGAAGLAEIARHRLSTPGNPRIAEEHYPHHPDGRSITAPRPRPRTPAEIAFLAIGRARSGG